ncbi:hypothetical protein LFL96_11100 [Paraburkholderia sp. D15]|uniref:hypothetical protein n=1 Tax=Paraburkholderia sp. D15 TaxID=2880218 RepID=UPI00247A7985|nr:hypothetical protein [Paraburkholderia sp. D15]WGS48350.1 hypothetical protein LFL96_11100 [Paraburkholderia sp. D15]WKF56225.1 hypothetical protein HUO10_000674 [Paraburkholderia busanensis]
MHLNTQARRALRLRLSGAVAPLRRTLLAAALPGVVLLGASLAGCASSNTTSLINLPNGQTGFAVNCSGADAASSWASCYVQAGKACGATGYDIVSKDNDEGGAAGGSVTNVVSANVKNRSMIVRCK